MKTYDYFKLIFVSLLTVGLAMSISIINEQHNDIKQLESNWNKSIQVSNDLFIIVEDKQLKIDLLLNQTDLQIRQYNTLLDKNRNISYKYNTLFNDYKKDVLVDTMIIRPTYQQVLSFLARDHTNIKTHTNNYNYNCVDFGNELIANARDEGLFACGTILYYLDKDTSHMIVAFNTIDKGIIYVEPQSDNVMTKNFGVGSTYWDFKITKIKSCWV